MDGNYVIWRTSEDGMSESVIACVPGEEVGPAIDADRETIDWEATYRVTPA